MQSSMKLLAFAIVAITPLASVGCAPESTDDALEGTAEEALTASPKFFYCFLSVQRGGLVATRRVHTPYRNGRALLKIDEELRELGPSEPVRIKFTYDSKYLRRGMGSGVVHDLGVAYSLRKGSTTNEWSSARETFGYIENFYAQRQDGSVEPRRPDGSAVGRQVQIMEFCSPITIETLPSRSVLVN
jgi:hypothetical protein